MDDDQIVGLEVWFDKEPVTRYIRLDEIEAPRLTAALIDDLLDRIDPDRLEQEAMAVVPIGEPLNLAARTLELIRGALHAELHDLGSSGASGDPSNGATA